MTTGPHWLDEGPVSCEGVASAMKALGNWMTDTSGSLPGADELRRAEVLARMELCLVTLAVAARRTVGRPDSAWMAEALEEYIRQTGVLDTYGPSAL